MSAITNFFIRIIPQHGLSNLIYKLTRIRNVWFKNLTIKWFIKQFNVDMNLAIESNPEAYKDFNSFFTRSLLSDARPLCKQGLCCPVDGTISQIGRIDDETIIQAKNHHYNLTALLGGSATLANYFRDGHFCCIYLSPRDYHRIHMPIDGNLREMTYVPGKLFSVNTYTAETVPSLFAINERVLNVFDTESGPMALIQVGAINVGSMETVWHGMVTPPYGKEITTWRYDEQTIELQRGDEMGRFNMGSTVILLFEKDAIEWDKNITTTSTVQMGQCLSKITASHEK